MKKLTLEISIVIEFKNFHREFMATVNSKVGERVSTDSSLHASWPEAVQSAANTVRLLVLDRE